MSDDAALTAGASDWRAGIAFQRSDIGETGSVVTDFGKRPGGGQRTKTREAQQDLGIGVLVELGDRRGGEVVCGCACCVELAQQGQDLLAHRRFDLRTLAQVFCSKHGLDAVDGGLEVAGAAGAFECGPQLATGELGGMRRRGRNDQNRAGVGVSEPTVGLMLERHQGGWVVFPQMRTQLVHQLLTVPYCDLLRACRHRDCLRKLGICGYRPVRMGVGAQDVGQYDGVAGVGFTADGVALAVASRGEWIDGIDGALGGVQTGNQQAAAGLDRHWDRIFRRVTVGGQHIHQLPAAVGVIPDAQLCFDAALAVDQRHLVMVFRLDE